MTREEKCKLAIERGYTYDPETGFIYNRFGKIVKNLKNNGYIYLGLTVEKKTNNLASHQFAWYCVYKNCNTEQIDHINGIKTDNRIGNLRAVTNQVNQWNRVKAKGYSFWKKTNKWRAAIKINKKDIHLGLFNTEQEARNAYLSAKEIYHKI